MDEKPAHITTLVEALAECPTLAEKEGRDLFVTLLGNPISSVAERRDSRDDDLRSIVNTCVNYTGGIDSLVLAVQAREKESVHMPEVRQRAAALKKAVEPEPEPIKPGREIGYVLSIGINKYYHDPEADSTTKVQKEFRDLSFATEDAREFYRSLRERGYYGPEPLLDEKATLRGIMRALDDLQRKCRDSKNPLVLIFFSGHGARDAEGRHYLVPHDGAGDDLFATAMWSKTFDNVLRLINTTRLIVFLDACHAAGIRNQDAQQFKGREACNPTKFLENEENRYLVSSCLAEQVSRETDGHGIFSKELLRLLRCEKEEDFESEEIELYGLYQVVKTRVMQATNDEQEPCANVQSKTDIILGINYARKQARVKRQERLLAELQRDFEDRDPDSDDRFLLSTALKKYIYEGSTGLAPELFYKYFRAYANDVKYPLPPGRITEVRTALIEYYQDGDFTPASRDSLGVRGPRVASAKDNVPTAQVATRTAVPSQAPTRSDEDTRERLPANRSYAQVGPLTYGISPDRRCLPSEDVSFLLENIREKANKPKYSGRIGLLKVLLSRPDGMSEKEFKTLQISTCRDGDPFWASLVDELGERFEKRWLRAFKPGAWTCSPTDLIDLALLASKLKQPDRPLDEWLRGRLSSDAEEALLEYQGSGSDTLLEEALLLCLNTIIHGPPTWDEERFRGITLRPETTQVRTQNPQGEDMQRLNRMLLEDAYPEELSRKQNLDPLSVRSSRILGSGAGSNA